ncbi:hypothetical protein [Brachybacterium sp. AOP29-B2-41]|uniref:hypothetical protein n=1 Tax=Brachybacterium sp. AOP29-B2-41 TaxID=3457704 RepID=UPI0040334585
MLSSTTGVLVQAIIEIRDRLLLLEAGNSRCIKVASVLRKTLGLECVDAAIVDESFDKRPVSGSPNPETGTPERYAFEPLQYPDVGPRMSILEVATEAEHLELGAPSVPSSVPRCLRALCDAGPAGERGTAAGAERDL